MFLWHLQNFENYVCELLVLLCSFCCSLIQFHGTSYICWGKRAVYWWKFNGSRLLRMAVKSNPKSSPIGLWWANRWRAYRNDWSRSVSRNKGRGMGSCLWLSSSSFVTRTILECFLWWQCALFSLRHRRGRQRTRAYHRWKQWLERPHQLHGDWWQASFKGMVYWKTYKIIICSHTKVLWQLVYRFIACKKWDPYRHSFHRFYNKVYQYRRKYHSTHRVGYNYTRSKIQSSYPSQNVQRRVDQKASSLESRWQPIT